MEYHTTSGIKVLDRAASILNAVAHTPLSLADLSQTTGLPRATAHRIASALEVHKLLSRDEHGRWALGRCLHTPSSLIDAATPILTSLVQETGESAQLYEISGNSRVCLASEAAAAGLQNIVPTGMHMPLNAGSAARAFVAFAPLPIPRDAAFSQADIDTTRKQGWAESISERQVGLASISAPIYSPEQELVAVLSISGLADRFTPSPGALWADTITTAAAKLSSRLH
ncbi:IclR-family transcriptional regulator [Corynebacterium renale]|uniref:IclR family transcriptional regulator n=1 Tax=Corynebacterium renale TaxID=1724 RepID=A0A2A9DQG1_9CORY|nr:IclR family transcriptional regulator [Corynebacterium renale]PFG28833.1 IclR family transcriptional regulator [Corynebacterium renale]SQG64575.1 IclR-family transcriptional regulator [Corynebacterium renale]SQI25677.1 IclR-family transcriptional regulator [Corynebacterium renale]STC95617.1 IclR-family transcriptional regulator [Corynebacterium renale]